MSNQIKTKFIDFLYSREEYVKQVNESQFRTRCPYCGDSTHSLNTGHLYILIDVDSDFNMPYICFRCMAKGVVNPDMLDIMNCLDDELKRGIAILNKRGKYTNNYIENNRYVYFERQIPEDHRYYNKIKYVENRLGLSFSNDDLMEMKVITSLYDFLVLNNINESPFNKQQRMILERDYIGFLSSGNSHILFRDTTGSHDLKWIKYPITKESVKNRVYYGLSNAVDIFTKDGITINLSEGVFDTIGIRYHLGYKSENTFNIAVSGQYFNAIIKHMIDVGVFGSNVILNLFSDNDKEYNKKEVDGSKESHHRKYLEKYKPLFKEVNLYYNLKSKDYGVRKEEIILDKKRI